MPDPYYPTVISAELPIGVDQSDCKVAIESNRVGDRMILLTKKMTGLGFVLLGGLVTAHGGSAHQKWEILIGLSTVMIGVVLLVMKIMHRNIKHIDRVDH
jgi:hypothetical protein